MQISKKFFEFFLQEDPKPDKPILPTKAVVVSGEASESDDDDGDSTTKDLPPLNGK